MTDEQFRARCKAYAMGWKETGELLDAERRQHVRQANTAESLARLEGLFNSAVWLHQPCETSGLVEQQAVLMRARR